MAAPSPVLCRPPSTIHSTMTVPRNPLKRPAPAQSSHQHHHIQIKTRPRVPSLTAPESGPMLPSQLPRSPDTLNPHTRPYSAGPHSSSAQPTPTGGARMASGMGAWNIRNEDLQTPITPPSAYSDFLKALSPALSTPATANSSFSTFSFTDRNGHLTPITQPSTAASFGPSMTTPAPASATLPPPAFSQSEGRPRAFTTAQNGPRHSPRRCPPSALSPQVLPPASSSTASAPLVPPSPFVRPYLNRSGSSGRTTSLRKLRIPQSPTFLGGSAPQIDVEAPSARSDASPRSALLPNGTYFSGKVMDNELRSPFSAESAALRSPFSPTSWYIEGQRRMNQSLSSAAVSGSTNTPLSAGMPSSPRSASQTVSVRQVVTKTVTYTRAKGSTPLEPAPRGKRRRVERVQSGDSNISGSTLSSMMSSSDMSSVAPGADEDCQEALEADDEGNRSKESTSRERTPTTVPAKENEVDCKAEEDEKMFKTEVKVEGTE